jgi:uncharacterized RDD family membrane protein YckC
LEFSRKGSTVADQTNPQAPAAPAPAPAADPGKVPISSRCVAAIIDGIIGGIAAFVVALPLNFVSPYLGGGLGGLVAAGWMIARDFVLGGGQSPGKKIMKYKIVGPDGQPCTQDQAIKRNIPMAAPSACSGVATLTGLVIGALASLLSLAAMIVSLWPIYETYLIYTDPEGKRWGDKNAGTKAVAA